MNRNESLNWKAILVSAFLSSVATGILFMAFHPGPVQAQSGISTSGLVFQASGRRDTDKNETYVFYDPAKGEIWFYRDEKCEKHLRITATGEPLQPVK